MRREYRQGVLVIRPTENGFVVACKGTIEDQQDGLDVEYSFSDIGGLLDLSGVTA